MERNVAEAKAVDMTPYARYFIRACGDVQAHCKEMAKGEVKK